MTRCSNVSHRKTKDRSCQQRTCIRGCDGCCRGTSVTCVSHGGARLHGSALRTVSAHAGVVVVVGGRARRAPCCFCEVRSLPTECSQRVQSAIHIAPASKASLRRQALASCCRRPRQCVLWRHERLRCCACGERTGRHVLIIAPKRLSWRQNCLAGHTALRPSQLQPCYQVINTQVVQHTLETRPLCERGDCVSSVARH